MTLLPIDDITPKEKDMWKNIYTQNKIHYKRNRGQVCFYFFET